jgi:hypothetical protein
VGDGSGFGFGGSWLEICVAPTEKSIAITSRPVVRLIQDIFRKLAI